MVIEYQNLPPARILSAFKPEDEQLQSLEMAREVVAGMDPCVREDLRPYARVMERLVGKFSHLLTPGKIMVLEERKTDLEKSLADKYAKGDMVVGINEFLLSNSLNNPEVRRTIAFWTQNPTPY